MHGFEHRPNTIMTHMPNAKSTLSKKIEIFLASLGERERKWVVWASFIALIALVWLLLLRPAIMTITESRTALPQLESQLNTVQTVAQKAKALQAQNPISNPPTANSLLESIRSCFGAAAQAQLDSERITVTLTQVTPEVLARCMIALDGRSADLSRTDGKWSGQFTVLVPAGI